MVVRRGERIRGRSRGRPECIPNGARVFRCNRIAAGLVSIMTTIPHLRPPSMTSRAFTSLLIIVALPALACSAADQRTAGAGDSCTATGVATMLADELARAQARNPVPGASAAIVWPGRLARPVVAAAGLSDLEAATPMSVEDRFLAGSVGKTFFAALALDLWSRGKLSLDRPISAYLPRVALPGADRVTVRMLLNHTSGYPEYDAGFMDALINDPLRVRQPDDWFDVIRRATRLAVPGRSVRYSDLNFVVLAAVLDRVEGGTAYAAIDSAFLAPLGLRSTMPSREVRIPRLVVGYEGERALFGSDRVVRDGALIYDPQFEWGGGGYASTPADLATWIAALRQGRALPDSVWSLMVARPVGVADSAVSWYGFGMHVDSTRVGRAYGHSGYIPGYLSWVRWYERAGVAISIQVNASDEQRVREDGYDWLDGIAERLLGDVTSAWCTSVVARHRAR